MPSHNLAKITIDDLDIIGYSIAGEETVIAMPQLDVCFDIGKAPDQVIPINHVLLTHGHMDHAAGIAYYLSHRNFCGQAAGTILAPENLLPPIKDIIDAWARLDGNQLPANLIGVKPGDEFYCSSTLYSSPAICRANKPGPSWRFKYSYFSIGAMPSRSKRVP